MTIFSWILITITLVVILIAWRLYSLYTATKQSYNKTLQERELVLSFLQEIGTAFTEAIDLKGLLNSVVDCSMRMLKASSGAIFLMNENQNALLPSIIKGTFPPWHEPESSVMEKMLSKSKYLEEYLKSQKVPAGTGLIGTVASTGKACLITNGAIDVRVPKLSSKMLEIKTALLVPLKIKDEVLGVLALVNKEDDQPFTKTDLSLLEALGDQAVISIRNAKIYQTVMSKQKLDNDLKIAQDIQHILLPKSCPKIDRWDISAWNKSAMEIGGDYYDFIDVGKNKLGVVIADVSGKSIPGALVMNTARSILRSKAVGVHSASSVLMSVNELVCQNIDPDMFISLLYIIIDTSTNTVKCARAGHEPLVFFHAKENTCELIKSDGMVIGMDDGLLFNNNLREINMHLNPGDSLVLYTDGITEAVNEKDEEFGIKNLLDAVRIASRGDANSIVNNISERINRFTGNIPQQDDLTLVALKVKE